MQSGHAAEDGRAKNYAMIVSSDPWRSLFAGEVEVIASYILLNTNAYHAGCASRMMSSICGLRSSAGA